MPQAAPADRGPRRGHAGAVPWHPYAQRAGADRAPHGRRHGDRLAVDADRDPLRLGGDDDLPRGQHAQAGGMPAAEQPDGLPRAVDRNGHHTEQSAIKPNATAQARHVPGPVWVVGYQQRLRRVDRYIVRERRQPCPAVALKQFGQRIQSRAQLVAAVGGGLDDLGVGTEGRVVDERLTADQSQVDTQLDTIGEGAQARRRVLAVQPQVEGEVVTGARGDYHERNAVLGSDPRYKGLGAVAARDAEQISACCDRLPRYLGHVDPLRAAHQEHVSAQSLRPPRQVELADLPAAGPRVHDQERMPGRYGRGLRHPPVRPVPGQGCARGHAREQPSCGRHHRHPEQGGERVHHDHRDRRQNENRQRQPAQQAPAGQDNERGGQAHGGGGQAHPEHREALQPGKSHHDHDRQEGQHETQASQPALRAGAPKGRVGTNRWSAGHPASVTRRQRRRVTRLG